VKLRVNVLPGLQRGLKPGPVGKRTTRGMGMLHTLFVLFLIGMFPVTAWTAEGRGYLDISGGHKTGDFGTATKSDLYYFSPALGFVTSRYDVSVTIPYLFLTDKSAGQTATEEGTGDIILRGGLAFVPETENGFSLSGSLAVKVPTADENKGLGTGEPDYGGFLGLRKRIGQNRFALSAGYIKVGDPAGIDFNDVSVYDAGYSRIFTRTELSAWYEGRRSIIPGAKNPREINVGFFHILNLDYSIKGSSFVGLNKGGPDFGLNLGIVRWF
jgi:outer membrane putative beta-barrel porin/alpha-amylase